MSWQQKSSIKKLEEFLFYRSLILSLVEAYLRGDENLVVRLRLTVFARTSTLYLPVAFPARRSVAKDNLDLSVSHEGP